ncbi:MAG: OsmC family protein [Kangiellaceae bacterium]|nr:OsmC family protein [Kangiellaceae bacterium]
MKATVTWQQGLEFEGKSESGYISQFSGDGKSVSPMETVLQAVGACSAVDVVMILQKARQDITDVVCQLTAERAETDPKVFTNINAHYQVSGNNISEKHVQRACDLSMEKYCSVSLMLKGRVNITHSYELIES